MLSRRTVLGLVGAGAAAVGVPVLVSAVRSGAQAADGLPLTVVNSTGRFPNPAIVMYIVGTDPAGNQGYVDQRGRFVPADASPGGAVDIAVPLAPTGVTSLTLPRMSGRVYFAINGRLRFTAVADAAGRPALQYPAGWLDSDPAYPVLHDFFEFTYNNDGMFCNTTMVDMFSIPMALRLTGAAEAATGKLADGGREAIFAELARQPGFEKLIVGDNLRIIAPGHGMETDRFAPTYFDRYIDEIWHRYTGTALRVRTAGGTYTGQVNQAGQLVFDRDGTFSRPTTRDVFFCNGALTAPNDGVGAVAAVLAAGFNRSVLDQADQPVTGPAAFYQNPVTNHYARVMHRWSADGRAYGFPFDDVGPTASYLEDRRPGGLQVTLTPFGAGAGDIRRLVDRPPPGTATVAVAPEAGGQPQGAGTGAYREIAADSFSAQQGIRTEPSTEGGRNIGYIANGDWVCYRAVDFGGQAPATQFQVRVASGAGPGISGLVEVRLDNAHSAPVGTIAVADTGGWQAWRTIPGNLAPVTGVHDVYLTFTSGQPAEYLNIRWLMFRR